MYCVRISELDFIHGLLNLVLYVYNVLILTYIRTYVFFAKSIDNFSFMAYNRIDVIKWAFGK